MNLASTGATRRRLRQPAGSEARLTLALLAAPALALVLTAAEGFFEPVRAGVPGDTAVRQAAGTVAKPSIETKTAGMQKIEGFFPLYWDEAAGTLWLEIPRLGTEVLYVTGLAAGIGSNDIGLDRGQLGGTRVVRFERAGPKILVVQPNYRFRATSEDPDERRAVTDSFATSIIWGFTVAAETGERVLVDASDFLLRDAHNAAGRLRPAVFRLDRSRSAVYMPRTKGFPRNTEMEVILTLTAEGSTSGAGGGRDRGSLSSVAPSVDSVTVRQHHSLVALPDPGFTPRRFDPETGFGDFSYEDYSAPLGQPFTQQFIRRHRLEKKDPSAKVSDPVKPIVYYVDRGVPEPMRSAILEGAGWWNQAFEAAGYRNAFRAELMPEDADSMDVRYNVIQWVHRSTRGWSYGSGVTDPRTGEIIQGHVTLGSLRVRQDYLLAEGLLMPYSGGDDSSGEVRNMAIARIRQLAAHEVGHAIGLGHNYYDSSRGYISVMDYPQPMVTLRPDGSVDVSRAYGEGIGEWDKVSIAWGYGHFPPGVDERAELKKILAEAWEKDLRYLSNQDADYNPRVDQWANGTDVASELNRMMDVRRVVLGRLGDNVIRPGRPNALVEEALVPMYLYHRYQVEATSSALGGLDYFYSRRGDGRQPWKPVPAAAQMSALEALLRTLSPAELAVPDRILKLLAPRPDGFDLNRELFPRTTGLPFDALTPAAVAADLTVSMVLRPERASRLVNQHALDPSLPGLLDVTNALVGAGFHAEPASAYEAEIARTVGRVVVDRLMMLAASAPMHQVRALAAAELNDLHERLRAALDGEFVSGKRVVSPPSRLRRLADDREWAAFFGLVADDIDRFLARPYEPYRPLASPSAPAGAPIGDAPYQWLPPRGLPSWWWDD